MKVKRLLVSFIIASTISLIIVMVLGDFGITWDEPVYFSRADSYIEWLKNPTVADRDRLFAAEVSDVHPPLRKLLAGITHELLANRLHIADNTRAYRISSLFFVFPLILVFTYIAIGAFGYAVGSFIPFVFSLMPHILFLTPLLTLDYAVMALWFLTVMFAAKGVRNYVWLTCAGITLGAALLTKFHGYLLYGVIVGYFAWYFRKTLFKRKLNAKLAGVIIRVIYLAIVAFVIYIALWPWLWTSTLTHLAKYFDLQLVYSGLTTGHNNIPVYIFGRTFLSAPWWYTPVMFFVTTPAFVLVFMGIGTVYTVIKGSTWDRFILLNAFFVIAFFSLPGVYRYDWIRLFLPAYPFAALIAGRGIAVVLSRYKHRSRFIAVTAVGILWLATLYQSVVRIHPWESAYYNEFVGGTAGASRLGFESEFWGNANLGVLPWMNWNKQTMMCVWPEWLPFRYYQAMGQIQAGVVFQATGDACKDIVILMRQGFFARDPYIAKIVATQKPIYTVSVDGVPLVGVYDRTGIQN